MAIRFYCPECKKPLEVDDTEAGKQVLCFYCRTKVTAPDQTDTTLAAAVPGETSAQKKPWRPTYGGIGFLLSLGVLVTLVVILIWAVGKTTPMIKTQKFASLPKERQAEVLNKEMEKLSKDRFVTYASLTILLLSLGAVGFSIAGIAANSGKGYAVAGLIIGGIFLMFQILSIFRSTGAASG